VLQYSPAVSRRELAAAAEGQRILGVGASRWAQLQRGDPNFPEPLDELTVGKIWDAQELRDYARTRNRSPGRPRKA
jgi:predicted pyridoxine 5'-phosphate oxidase superfamily flavin-nucleotide-binding protein